MLNNFNPMQASQTSSLLSDVKKPKPMNTILAQEDFLKLLVAQMSHQDPMQPEDPGDFLGQLAQFGTVDGIQQLNNSIDSFGSSIHSNKALQAASMVGRSVHIPSNVSILGNNGLDGSVEIPNNANEVKVFIKTPQGEIVKTISLGNQPEGNINFQWDGIGDNGQSYQPGEYGLEAHGIVSGRNNSLATFTAVNVDSVTINSGSNEVLLNLHGLGAYSLRDVTKIS